MVLYISNPSTQELERGASEFQGHPQLDSKFRANLRYVRLCFF